MALLIFSCVYTIVPQRGHEEAGVIHKTSIQIGSVISEALLQLNRYFASDHRLLMAASCCLRSL